MGKEENFSEFRGMIKDGSITVALEFKLKDGRTIKKEAKDPDDFFNEAVPKGATVGLITAPGRLLAGQYGGIEETDDGFELQLFATGSTACMGIPMDKIIGYYEREEIL